MDTGQRSALLVLDLPDTVEGAARRYLDSAESQFDVIVATRRSGHPELPTWLSGTADTTITRPGMDCSRTLAAFLAGRRVAAAYLCGDVATVQANSPALAEHGLRVEVVEEALGVAAWRPQWK